MPIQFVLGRAGSGKTHWCLQAIQAECRKQPLGSPLFMIVPEQATFQTDQALLGPNSGLIGSVRAQVVSFRRLAYRVMQETGGTALTPIQENGKQMLLYKIMYRLRTQLQLFHRSEQKRGFIAHVNDLLTEWQRYGIERPYSALSESDQSTLLGRKLQDLQLIQEQLEAQLTGKYIDSEGYLLSITQRLAEAPSLRGAHYYIDGFHGFTPLEMDALSEMLRSGATVTITLTLDRPSFIGQLLDELALFYPTAHTMQQLLIRAEQEGIEVLEPVLIDHPRSRHVHNAPLAHLERQWSAQRTMREEVGEQQEAVRLRVAPNPRVEVEAVARDIFKQVREGGYRYRDIGILIRDEDAYPQLIHGIFTQYGIPHYVDQKRAASLHPFAEFVRSSLEVAYRGWNYEPVFRAVKTGYFVPWGADAIRGPVKIGPSDYDALENYVLATGISGRRWTDASFEWRPYRSDSLKADAPQDVEQTLKFQAIVAARDTIVQPLAKLEKQMRSDSVTIRARCEALYAYLERVKAPRRIALLQRLALQQSDYVAAMQLRQVWEGLMRVLDQLVELNGDESVPLDIFIGMIELGLESLKMAQVPATKDQVIVANVDRSRTGSLKVVYVLDVSAGKWPRSLNAAGILTEQERQQLADRGLVLAPSLKRKLLDDRFVMYTALSTPSDKLWLSYSLMSSSGSSHLPSEIIEQVERSFIGVSMSPLQDFPPNPLDALTNQISVTLSQLIIHLRQLKEGSAIDDVWLAVYNSQLTSPALKRLLTALDYENVSTNLSARTVDELYGKQLSLSVSRLETYRLCSFRYFVSHGLKLRERPLYQLQSSHMGTFFHEVLYRFMSDNAQQLTTLTSEQIKERIHIVARELIPRVQGDIMRQRGRDKYTALRLTEMLVQSVLMIKLHLERGLFMPIGFEVGFGTGAPQQVNGHEVMLDPWTIPLDEERSIAFRGVIDRFDWVQDETGKDYVRIIDYKSSPQTFTVQKVVEGLSLQLVTYLYLVSRHYAKQFGFRDGTAVPAGALYYVVQDPLEANNEFEDESKILLRRLSSLRMDGLVTGNSQGEVLKQLQLHDQEVRGEGGIAQIQPAKVKKDGSLSSHSTQVVLDEEDWNNLFGELNAVIKKMGQQIVTGNTSLNPVRLGQQVSCTYCAYKPVCQLDAQLNAGCIQTLTKVSNKDVLDGLKGGESK